MSELSTTNDAPRNHTPGPWTWDWYANDDEPGDDGRADADGLMAGDSPVLQLDHIGCDATISVTPADARLIAAAPALLAACEALVDEAGAVSRYHLTPISGDAILELRDAIAQARAAVKA